MMRSTMFLGDMSDAQAAAFAERLGHDAWPPASYAYDAWRLDHLGDVASTYVVCLRDETIPPPWQERFAARAAAKRVIRIDAGHQVMNTRPHGLAEILRDEALRSAPAAE